MKFIHTGDLHIGKTINDFNLLKDQKFILDQMIKIAKEEKVDAFVIAGDIYDRSIPSAEAVVLLDEFLSTLQKEDIKVFMISGNHDSPERISFGKKILEKQGLFIQGIYEEPAIMNEVICKDEFGQVSFFFMPFVKPAVLNCKTSDEMIKFILEHNCTTRETDIRKVLISHFFVTNNGKEPELSDSETTIHVGGLDNVEASNFKDFDYVALGHIHKPQQIGEGPIYYAGSPLKFSFSEVNQCKSVNIVELRKKGEVIVKKRELIPLHEMRKIKGLLDDLIKPEITLSQNCNDYLQITLINEEELLDPIGVLRNEYPNVMQLLLAKNESVLEGDYQNKILKRSKSPYELFEDFYEIVRDKPMDDKRRSQVMEAMKEAEER
ncbi:MAG TPA: exonuclease SbcCD subunit D [Lachnospiraceae bacterium]|nr:exonuclease SbcCD subunit D [Lachnospiraceae bacterium]